MTRTLTLALLALLALLVGCGDDSTTTLAPEATSDITADMDAAEAVAADLGAEDGGLADQLSDLSIALDGLGSAKSADEDFVHSNFVERIYDEATGTWTITVERERGDPDGIPYASIRRVYTLRLLNAAGEPQQFRVVGQDTATAAEYAIVSGSGEHRTRRLEQSLDELYGAFTVTGLDTDLVTINGTYHRAAGHHLETAVFSRTLDGVLDLELIDVMMPRRHRPDHASGISGTIAGTFVADIVIERGDDYAERHIDNEFTIVLSDGAGDLNMRGRMFRLDLRLGELCD